MEVSNEDHCIAKFLPFKLEMSLEYSKARTFHWDLEILFRTVPGFYPPSAKWKLRGTRAAAQSLPEFISRNSS